jgi:hypothetical protein
MRRCHTRGLALILVLIVILALGAIATPFVLSMIMHEKTAASERARSQAAWGAEGSRNLSAVRLVRGTDHFERLEVERGRPGTPYVDDPSEFEVRPREARRPGFEVDNPRGPLWGAAVQDEQAKINVTSAPARVADAIRSRLGPRVIDHKDALTLYSGRTARWVRPQKIRAVKPDGVGVDEVRHLGRGVRVRATKPGLPSFETLVVRNDLQQDGRAVIGTRPPIPASYLHGLLEAERRHPVNVNTARRETLEAVFGSLAISVSGADRSREIGDEETQRIVDGLFRRRVSTWHEFLALVLGLDVADLVKAAVLINAVDPGNHLLHDGREGRGTVPFCFVSDDTITVQALAAQNGETGTVEGSTAFREVVDLGSPVRIALSWENQFDFDRMMGPPRLLASDSGLPPALKADVERALRSAGLLDETYLGYPFGCGMESFPRDREKGQPSDMTLKFAQGKDPNYVTGRAERDHRGRGRLFHHVEHFDEELDGLSLASKAFLREPGIVFAPSAGRADVSAGGTEFWVRFDRPVAPARRVTLFNVREADETNRMSIELHKGEISFRITDSTARVAGAGLDKGWTEIRAPFVPEEKTWYHVGAYWKGTRYGQMLLMIDGFVPEGAKWRLLDKDERTDQSSELTSMIPRPGNSDPVAPLPLKDPSFCRRPPDWPAGRPWTVPLRIGDEIVEYEPTSGFARRGARSAESVYGPSAVEHPAGAKATLFGYTSVLRSSTVQVPYEPPHSLDMTFGPLQATKGKLVHGFGLCRNAILVGEKRSKSSGRILGKGRNRVHFQLLSDVPTDTDEWPDSGYIRIEREAIYYRKIVRETRKNGYFDLCERGRAGTEDVDHMEGIPIELWGVAVDHPDTTLPNPTIVQFGREWFGPARLVEAPGGGPARHYWIGATVNGGAVPFGRGPTWMTPFWSHERSEPLVPIFAAREWNPQVRRTNLQPFDPVTVMESSNHRETHFVGNAITWEELRQYWYEQEPVGPRPSPPRNLPDQGIQLASLAAPVTRDVPVDGRHNRILKWPSGELVGERFLSLLKPPVAYGPADVTLDEVKNMASPKSELHVEMIAPASMPDLRLREGLDSPSASGAVVVGEEIIGFAETMGPARLIHATREYLNSTGAVHDRGDAVFHLDFLPVAAIRGSLNPLDRNLSLSQALIGSGYTRGCVLVDDEVIGFEGTGETGVDLDALARFDGFGLLRGLFGTTPAGHPRRSMVFGIPVRFRDGFKEGQFDNRMPYFQVAHVTRDARWNGVRVTAAKDADDRLLKIHCRVRIDGHGELERAAVDERGSVRHFADSAWNPLGDFISSRDENGRIDIRFQLEYLEGAYWPSNSWKRTWKLHDVRADYDRNTRVLFHEDE